jgi:hypothetical protein
MLTAKPSIVSNQEGASLMLLNLTPHPIHILNVDSSIAVSIPAYGDVLRVLVTEVAEPSIFSNVNKDVAIPVTRRIVGHVSGLRQETEELIDSLADHALLIVSAQSVEAVKLRFPYAGVYTVGVVVRDADGKPMGVLNLVSN